MEELFEKTKSIYAKVNRINNNEREYLIISNFGLSSVIGESGAINPLFRIFTPVKVEKGRKLNSVYGGSFNPYKDTLMDYPTIIQYKLGKVGQSDWNEYNRLVSVHISSCPINCWHCYLEECLKAECNFCSLNSYCDENNKRRKESLQIKKEWITAKKLLTEFIEQRNQDKTKNTPSNVLRITGGEPFLVPNLLLEILRELKNLHLEKEIFLWTETNLIPLCIQNDHGFIISDDLLKELGQFQNFCVHPCFHGISVKDFEENTGEKIGNFEVLTNAFKRLICAGIDVYPTFGSNVNTPESIVSFYQEISKIDNLLPLRFNLIEFDLDYSPIKWRRSHIQNYEKTHSVVYDRFLVIDKWNELLIKNTGYRYGDIPRQLVPIKKKELMSMTDIAQSTLHLFKRPAVIDYQQKFLHVLSLPVDVSGEVNYPIKWVDKGIKENIRQINDNGIDALFWVVDCNKVEGVTEPLEFSFKWAYPIRKLRITEIDESTPDIFKFRFIAKEFIADSTKIEDIESLKRNLNIEFNSSTTTSPCKLNGFVFIGPKFDFEEVQLEKKRNLAKIYEKIKDIPSLENNKQDIRIKEYPIVFIEGIKKLGSETFLIPNQKGKYELNIDEFYNIILNFYQGDEHRSRDLYINEKKYSGKTDTKPLQYRKIQENDQELFLEIRCPERIEYPLQIPIEAKKVWYKEKYTKIIVLLVLSIIPVLLFKYWINPTDITVVYGLITAAIIFVVNKLWDLFTNN